MRNNDPQIGQIWQIFRTRKLFPKSAQSADNVDEAHARRVGLRGVALPGPLLGALFSCLLGTNWLKQRLVIGEPVYPGDELTAHVQIVRLRPEKALVNLRTWVVAAGDTVCDGEALVWVGDQEGLSAD